MSKENNKGNILKSFLFLILGMITAYFVGLFVKWFSKLSIDSKIIFIIFVIVLAIIGFVLSAITGI